MAFVLLTLKLIEFTPRVVPRMGLMANVLAKARLDLLFFAIIFAISLFSFSLYFTIQLGHVQHDFSTYIDSLITLTRALFGDFDVLAIQEASPTLVNPMVFLAYLFVSVFILLSTFLALLAEAQAAVRGDEASAREAGQVWQLRSAGWVLEYPRTEQQRCSTQEVIPASVPGTKVGRGGLIETAGGAIGDTVELVRKAALQTVGMIEAAVVHSPEPNDDQSGSLTNGLGNGPSTSELAAALEPMIREAVRAGTLGVAARSFDASMLREQLEPMIREAVRMELRAADTGNGSARASAEPSTSGRRRRSTSIPESRPEESLVSSAC